MMRLASPVWPKRRHLLCWALAGLAIGPAAARANAAMPRSALILFGAHWCAPCAGELHNLAELGAATAALRPDRDGRAPRLVLAWIDRPLRIADPRAIEILPPTVAQALAEAPLAEARGLPFTLVTDAAGRTCAMQRGPLRPAAIAALWASCLNAL